jgi:hypothetical protein
MHYEFMFVVLNVKIQCKDTNNPAFKLLCYLELNLPWHEAINARAARSLMMASEPRNGPPRGLNSEMQPARPAARPPRACAAQILPQQSTYKQGGPMALTHFGLLCANGSGHLWLLALRGGQGGVTPPPEGHGPACAGYPAPVM